MKRKIVKQGAATMTISLPASWIKKFNLKVGDELNIDEVGNKIEISTEKAMGERKIELDYTKIGKFVKSDLSHIYVLGYDEVVIHFKNEETLKRIQEVVPVCIGYEIVEQSEDKIIIKSISSALEEEFDNILRKTFLMLKEMSENVHDALKNREFARLKQIRQMESINNKFTNFLKRVLSKKGYSVQGRTLPAYDMIQNLERVADEYKYICDDLIDNKRAIDKNVLILLKEINDYFELVYGMYYKFEPNKKIKIYEKRRELRKKAVNLLKSNTEVVLTSRLINVIEKIQNTAGSYLAIKI